MSISMDICQSDFISLISEKAVFLNMNVEESHYESNSDYYWKNKGQFISVLNKGITDDKLKIIFQTHIQKVSKVVDIPKQLEEEIVEIIPQVKLQKTQRYYVFVKI
jgi:hypothetical protein